MWYKGTYTRIILIPTVNVNVHNYTVEKKLSSSVKKQSYTSLISDILRGSEKGGQSHLEDSQSRGRLQGTLSSTPVHIEHRHTGFLDLKTTLY